MKGSSLFLTSFVTFLALSFAGCRHADQPQIEKRVLSDSESARQIQLLKSIDPEDIEGKMVSDFPELFSLADEICFENGIVRYSFYRKGEGGNDDGSDSTAVIEVVDKIIRGYYIISIPS